MKVINEIKGNCKCIFYNAVLVLKEGKWYLRNLLTESFMYV